MVEFRTPLCGLVKLIGDPHIGKDFDKNCPPHRRGERSTHQLAELNAQLNEEADMIIAVGDIFDTPYVSRETIISVASAFMSAAENNPDRVIVAMAGNHDLPRNLAAVGAWTVFSRILDGGPSNLHVVRYPKLIGDVALYPWEWTRTALEQIEDLEGPASAAVGHWDLVVYDKDDHMAPVEALRARFGDDLRLFSGHFHTSGWYGEVFCTGSMQPISHGEDPDELFYVTRTLAEVMEDPSAYKYKHVRLVVEPGEVIPELDCLGVTHLRSRPETERLAQTPKTFDWVSVLASKLPSLDPAVQTFIVERFPDADPSKQLGRGSGLSGSGSADGDTGQHPLQPLHHV